MSSTDAVDRHGRRSMFQLSDWKLLSATVLLVLVYVVRHTGGLGQTADVADEVLIAVALFLSLSVAEASRTVWAIHIVVAASAIGISVVGALSSTPWISTVGDALGAYMLVVTIVVQLSITLSHRRVTGDTLFGAAAVYLAIGIVFGIVFTAVAVDDPAAFDPPQVVVEGETKLYYFSFVTLTSLGYGDISPTGDAVQILATLEAVLGVILLAALVGRIVGLLVAQEKSIMVQEQQAEIIEEVRSIGTDDARGVTEAARVGDHTQEEGDDP